MIAKYLLLLGIGHVLGDFYFQSEKMAVDKDRCFKGVIIHSIEYLLVMVLVMILSGSADMVKGALFLSVLHFIIDAVKYKLLRAGKFKKSAGLFISDQCAHIVCMLIVAYIMYMYQIKISDCPFVMNLFQAFGIQKETAARWILALLIINRPSNILIQNIINKGSVGNKAAAKNDDNKAGRKIGFIERLIMLLFISMDQYTAMGVVLTAKSIARFDRIAKDESFAEYYLLGTLISTACVVVCKVVLL